MVFPKHLELAMGRESNRLKEGLLLVQNDSFGKSKKRIHQYIFHCQQSISSSPQGQGKTP